jgi:hypothetical protein
LLAEMFVSKGGMAFIYDLQLTMYEKLALELELGKESSIQLTVRRGGLRERIDGSDRGVDDPYLDWDGGRGGEENQAA